MQFSFIVLLSWGCAAAATYTQTEPCVDVAQCVDMETPIALLQTSAVVQSLADEQTLSGLDINITSGSRLHAHAMLMNNVSVQSPIGLALVKKPASERTITMCADDEDFRDEFGYLCYEWRRYDCDKIADREWYRNGEPYRYKRWQKDQIIQQCPFSCKKCEPNAAQLAGVKFNSAGDFEVFMSGLQTYAMLIVASIVIFRLGVWYYPEMYTYNLNEEQHPKLYEDITKTWFGWARASWKVTNREGLSEAESVAGLDAAMMIEFTEVAMKILFIVSLPTAFLVPLHILRGRGDADDRLSRIAMANVMDNHPWMYWVHVICVWNVTLTVYWYARDAQQAFLPRRFKWLQRRPRPVFNTIMVSRIEDEYRSDEYLRKFFSNLFHHVERAYVVKKTGTLIGLVAQRDSYSFQEREARLRWEKDKAEHGPNTPQPEIQESFFGAKVGALDYYSKKMEELDKKIKKEQQRIEELKDKPGGINSDVGFVTFRRHREAAIALSGVRFSHNKRRWLISQPPEPSEVLWHELAADRHWNQARMLIGILLVAGIFFGYLPICVGVTQLAFKVDVGSTLNPYWQAIAPTLGLLFFVNFLPTIFLLIFHTFFNLKTDRSSQVLLQDYYFYFQVVFVLLVSAVGQSVDQFLVRIAQQPFTLFSVLAESLPDATHFYMNFLVIQWGTHFMNLTRYVPVFKYMGAKKIYPEAEAREMAEPEDQDYYGIGGRSARWTINLLIGIVFSTISPSMGPLALINFAICRLNYGYLLVFAETPKTDLGGVFWVKALKHLQYGVFVYLIMMVGVLAMRPLSNGPMIVAAPTLFIAFFALKRFREDFLWDTLPFDEVGSVDDAAVEDDEGSKDEIYCQPELDWKPGKYDGSPLPHRKCSQESFLRDPD